MYSCILVKIKAIFIEELFIVEFSYKEKEIVKIQVEYFPRHLSCQKKDIDICEHWIFFEVAEAM